jgi:hypothetical protein
LKRCKPLKQERLAELRGEISAAGREVRRCSQVGNEVHRPESNRTTREERGDDGNRNQTPGGRETRSLKAKNDSSTVLP